MVLATMYPPQKDSPSTFLTGNITATDTLITVGSVAILPQVVPYPLTIGIDKNVTETVIVTAIGSGNNQLTVTRQSGSLAWEAGAKCARVFTASDLKTLQDNVKNVVTQSNADNASIGSLTPRVTAAENAITANKTAAETATGVVATNLTAEVTRATGVENTLNTNKVNRTELPQVLTDLNYTPSPTAMTETINRYNASNQTNSTFNRTIPVVNNANVGIMTPEAYNEIAKLRTDVNTLINEGGAFIGVSFPTKATLDAYVVPESIKMGDYTYVKDDETHKDAVTRYVYNAPMGTKWSELITSPFGGADIRSLIYTNGVLIGVGSSGIIARSTDDGLSWSAIIANPFGTAVICAITSINGVLIAVGTSGKIARSTDDGLTWGSLIANPFGTSIIYSIATANGILIAVATDGKIARSTDNGLTWGSLVTNPFEISVIYSVINVNGVLLAGCTSGKIARSTDNGLTWGSLVTNPFGTSSIRCFAYTGNAIIASTDDGKIARSTDNGLTWGSLVTNPFGSSSIFTITNIKGVLIAGTQNGKIARSTDDGLTWGSLIANPFGTSIIYSVINVNSVAIACSASGKIARSAEWDFTFVVEHDPVGLANSTTPGLVKSDPGTTDGKVFVETDGTQSVIGWNNLNDKIDDIADSRASFEDRGIITGTFAHFTNAAKGVAKIADIEGKSYQVVTDQNKNLWDYRKIATVSHNGIVFTNNNNGTYTINGTATANAFTSSSTYSLVVPAGTYTLSGGGQDVKVVARYLGDDGVTTQYPATETGRITITFTSARTVYLYIQVPDGKTISSLIISPQFESGDVAAPVWVANVPNSPSPEYPAPITPFNALGTAKARAIYKKNLLDSNNFKTTYTALGITLTKDSNGKIFLNGTATDYVDIYILNAVGFGGFYTASTEMFNLIRSIGNHDVSLSNNLVLSNNLRQMSDGAYVLNTAKANNIINAFVRINPGRTFTNAELKIQLEIGPTATPYEPYKGNETTILFSGYDLPNGVKDMPDIEKCKQITLNGTETITYYSANPSTSRSFTIYLPVKGKQNGLGILSDRFVAGGLSNKLQLDGASNLYFRNIPNTVFGILESDDETTSKTKIKAWFVANPTVVVYERADPIPRTPEDIFVQTYDGETNISIIDPVQTNFTAVAKSELWSNTYLQDLEIKKLQTNKLDANKVANNDITTDAAYAFSAPRGKALRDDLNAATKYQKAGGTATNITLSNVKFEDGFSITFIVTDRNSGAATKINGKNLYKPVGTTTPTLATGRAVTVWYDLAGDCFFIKASAEGDAVAANVLAGKKFSTDIDTGITGTMVDRGAIVQALAANGSYMIPEGYHNGSGQITQALTTKAAATITPGTTDQVIAANQYLTGAQTIKGNANLIPENILSNKNIFGVLGNVTPYKMWTSSVAATNSGTVREYYTLMDTKDEYGTAASLGNFNYLGFAMNSAGWRPLLVYYYCDELEATNYFWYGSGVLSMANIHPMLYPSNKTNIVFGRATGAQSQANASYMTAGNSIGTINGYGNENYYLPVYPGAAGKTFHIIIVGYVL